MSYQETTAQSAKKISRVQRRRKGSKRLIEPLAFAKMHNGKFQMKIVGGVAYCRFVSCSGHSLGISQSLERAYRKSIREYNEKYNYAGV